MRQDFGKDVGDVVLSRDKDKLDHLRGNLFSQPRHLDTEMPIACSYHVVRHHCDARLIVLAKLRGSILGETKFSEEVADPEQVFDSFGGRDKLGLCGGETYRRSSLSQPAHEAVGNVDRMTISGPLLNLICERSVGEGGDINGAKSPGVHDGIVGGGEQVSENADCCTPVRAGRALGVLARAANHRGNIWPGNSCPEKATHK